MIHRVIHNKDNPYFQMNRCVLQDARISWKAAAILAYLLSRPDNWVVRESDLIKQHTDGRDAVRSGLKELRDAGYIRRVKIRENGRFIGTECHVYETPQPDIGEASESCDGVDDSPQTDFPAAACTACGKAGAIENNDSLVSIDKDVASEKPDADTHEKVSTLPESPVRRRRRKPYRLPDTALGPGLDLGDDYKPPEISRRAQDAAEKLHTAVVRKGVLEWSAKPRNWPMQLQSFLDSGKVTPERFDEILEWYCDNLTGFRVPEAFAAESFCEKFQKIEAARRRAEGPEVDDDRDVVVPSVQVIKSTQKMSDEEYMRLIRNEN